MRRKACVLGLFLALVLFPRPVSASSHSDVKDDRAVLSFPDAVTFRARIESETPIRSVVLEYGTDEAACGNVVAKAFPKFDPAKSVSVEWTWEMKQSGSLPPGASLWWRWRYADEDGREVVTERRSVTWLDETHDWKTLTDGPVNLHWYRGEKAFAQDLLDAAVAGLALIEKDAGLKADQPVHLYIYAGVGDLKDAILYEPSWVGGLAFPEHNIVIIGIAPADVDWGRRAEVHELTHVLVGHLTFSCLGDVPTWLNEGLAVYSEGDLEPAAQAQLDDAIRDDTLVSVRSLSGAFSEVSDKASLSYSQSYSLVKFVIEQYGRGRMTDLLVALREGNAVDDALTQVYGFDVEGLEDAWRASVGARPRAPVAEPTARPTPTLVPTIIPVSGVPLAITPTPLVFPPTPTPESGLPVPGDPFQVMAFAAILLCVCALAALLGIVVLLAVLANRRGKES